MMILAILLGAIAFYWCFNMQEKISDMPLSNRFKDEKKDQ